MQLVFCICLLNSSGLLYNIPMWTDVVDLRDYYETNLGQVTRRLIRRKLRTMWPNVSGQSVLGLGYATPYLTSFRSEASRVVAAMPERQGVLHWPEDEKGLTTLVDELDLPFEDSSIDRIVLVHALEHAEQVRPLLREIWRVLVENGRVVVIAPNRRGVWARFEKTPFGHGLPYSSAQLSRLLRDNLFTPLVTTRALYVPPSGSRMVLSSALAWESICSRFLSRFGGVIMTEASKQIYAGHMTANKEKTKNQKPRTYIPLPETMSKQSPKISQTPFQTPSQIIK